MGMAGIDLDLLERAAGLHDVGKIGVPNGILLKPDRLTPEEFEVVKTHTVIGRGSCREVTPRCCS